MRKINVRKCRMQRIRWEVIKNYVAFLEDYGSARKMVNVKNRLGKCHQHLTFLFMAEFVSSLRGRASFHGDIAAYGKPKGCENRN